MTVANVGRVLIVDEDARYRALIRVPLQEAGFQTDEAEDRVEAFRKASEGTDAILIDTMMTGLDGLALIRQLKSDAATLHIPIIGLHAVGNEEVKRQMLEAGAEDFMLKSTSHLELCVRIRNLVRLKNSLGQLAEKNKELAELLKERSRQLGTASYLFSHTLDALPAHIAIIDSRGIITAVNEAWRTFCRDNGGDTATYYVGEPYLQIQDEREEQEWDKTFNELLSWKRTTHTYEYDCQSPTEERWFRVDLSAVQAGSATYVVAVHNDISEGRRTQTALQQSESIFKTLVVTAPAIISVINRKGEVLLANVPSHREGAGMRRSEPYESAFDFIAVDARQLMERAMDLAQKTKTVQTYDAVANLPDLGPKWTHTLLRHLDGDGPDATFLFYTSDISVRKSAERELHRSREQLLQSQKLEAIGALAGGVAHDFNNLLTVIMSSCSQLARRNVESADTRTSVDEIMAASERAASLTGQLLAFSRQEPEETTIFDLSRNLRDIQPLLSRTIGENIDLSVHNSVGEARVEANANQIDLVIINLVVNARDAMPDGGSLHIGCEIHDELSAGHEPPRQFVEISVSDTGSGMDAETKSRVFEPFFSTKARGRGTGLGLATSYGIIKSAGGQIQVQSQLGSGSCFKVRLPLSKLALSVAVGKDIDPASLVGTEVVLIVEDDRDIRRALQLEFEEAGYHVVVARSGEEAIREFENIKDEVQLLVSDILLPGISGFEVAIQILKVRPTLPILLATGFAGDVGQLRFSLPRDIPVLRKPFRAHQVLHAVRKILDAPRRDPKPLDNRPASVGDDARQCVLIVDDEPSLRRAFARMLAGKFDVLVAADAVEALKLLASGGRIDAMLCDLNLGRGRSGQSLYEEVSSTHPELARHTLFLTGGPTGKAATAFVREHEERVIQKPPQAGQIVHQLKMLLEG